MTVQFNPDVRALYEDIIKRNVIHSDNFEYMPQRYGGARVRDFVLSGNDGHFPSTEQILHSNMGGFYGRASHPIAVGSGRRCGGVGVLKEARVEPFINELDMDYMPVSAMHGNGRAPRLTKRIKEQILADHPELRQHMLRGGKIDWNKIWKGVKDTMGFVSKAAPIVSSLAPEEYRDSINKTGEVSGALSGLGRRKSMPKKGASMSLAADLLGNYATKRRGKGFWKDFGQGLKQGFKTSTGIIAKAAPVASLLMPEFAPEIGAVGAISGVANSALGGRRKQLPRSGKKRETARGLIVGDVMRKYGMSLPEASHYVKANNLY
jgi:hypothetical protein